MPKNLIKEFHECYLIINYLLHEYFLRFFKVFADSIYHNFFLVHSTYRRCFNGESSACQFMKILLYLLNSVNKDWFNFCFLWVSLSLSWFHSIILSSIRMQSMINRFYSFILLLIMYLNIIDNIFFKLIFGLTGIKKWQDVWFDW